MPRPMVVVALYAPGCLVTTKPFEALYWAHRVCSCSQKNEGHQSGVFVGSSAYMEAIMVVFVWQCASPLAAYCCDLSFIRHMQLLFRSRAHDVEAYTVFQSVNYGMSGTRHRCTLLHLSVPQKATILPA